MFPYGNTYDDGTKCNDYEMHKKTTLEWVSTGSLPQCQSPDPAYAGVYDQSGNVWEWEDACDGNADGEDWCRIRGGSVRSEESTARCDTKMAERRRLSDGILGFRCCSD